MAVVRDAGLLIVFEGPEGAGKTTQLRRLAAALQARQIPVAVYHEPGATPVGSEIRRLLLDTPHDIVPRAEALLFMASRAQLVEREVRPALERGTIVLLDRFFLSTYAYQSAARGLPELEVRAANALATGGLVPDLTILLAVSPAEGMARADQRSQRDRMERSGDQFHDRVSEAFASFATPTWQQMHPECGPIALVEAHEDESTVFGRIVVLLALRWPETFAVLNGKQH